MNVTLYSTHCPKCRVIEQKLQMYGIEYKVIDDVEVMRNLGFKEMPQLCVDSEAPMNFMAANKWLNLQKKEAANGSN